MAKKFLSGAYELENQEQTKQLYKDWAATYDAELQEHGYASPSRVAKALLACGADTNSALLDIGCGSGISGLFLREEGFAELHGSDFSPEMLEQADQKGIYTKLHLADFSAPFKFIDKPFRNMTAVGVFLVGHAGPDVLETVIDLMPINGLFSFSLNDPALQDTDYLALINQQVLAKRVRIRWQEYGDNLPGIGVNSMIVVLERLA